MNTNMSKYIRIFCLFACFMTALLFGGCEKEEVEEGNFIIYYLNSSSDGLASVKVNLESDNFDDQVQEILSYLKVPAEDNTYMNFLNEDLKIPKYSYSDGYFDLYFDGKYEKLSAGKKHLIRYALVKTFTQLKEIDVVGFYNHDQQLMKADGTPFGYLAEEDFLEAHADDLPLKEITVSMYYADSYGTGLSMEKHKIKIEMFESMEKAVVKELMKEPDNDNNRRVIPEYTILLDVNTSGGTCYVNFDHTFGEATYSVEPIVVINAIATTLTQLEGVERVQIQIEGSSDTKFLDSVDLRKTYTGN